MTSEAESGLVTLTTNGAVTSSTVGVTTEVTTLSSQLLTSDEPSSLTQSETPGDATTTTQSTTTVAAETTMKTTITMPETTTEYTEVDTTSTQQLTTTLVTSQKTTTSAPDKTLSSGLTTVAQVTRVMSPDVRCCCRCCFPFTPTCKVCDGETVADASECANEQLKVTEPLDRNAPKFEPPAALQGSEHPERLQYREDFIKTEQLTESLASLSESQKIDLGFKFNELIVDCVYNGAPCSVKRLVHMFASNSNRNYSHNHNKKASYR